MKKAKYVVLAWGEKREITGEEGKYWLCGDTRIRKLSESILRVESATEDEPPKGKAPDKKTTAKKRKTED